MRMIVAASPSPRAACRLASRDAAAAQVMPFAVVDLDVEILFS